MKAFIVLTLLAALASGAEAVAQEPREDLDLRTFLLKEMFRSCAKTGEVCYVAFASRQEPGSHKTLYTDPPASFLSRFAKCPFTVQSASQYTGSTNTAPKVNPITGIPDGIYTVEIKRWVDSSSARVSVSLYRSETWARGHEEIVEKQFGKWEVREILTKWSK